jgi:hypothetical protein
MHASRSLTGPSIRTARTHRRSGRLRLALAVWLRGAELDHRLAAGEDPWASDELALRARRLTTARSRTRVASGLAGVLRSAGNGSPGFTAAVRPRSEDVREVGALIASIERRLRAPGPVAAQGVAIVRLLLIDGNGPLYRPSDPGALGGCLRAAAAGLRAPVAGD